MDPAGDQSHRDLSISHVRQLRSAGVLFRHTCRFAVEEGEIDAVGVLSNPGDN